MAKNGNLTIVDKLIISAYSLHKSGKDKFTSEDLVVASWKQFPGAFGLSGYYDNEDNSIYPDSNRVYAEIMGSKPIRKQGFMKKVGTKMYQLTDAGVSKGEQLQANDTTKKDVQKLFISRDILSRLKNMLNTKAVHKYRNDDVDKISFYDACSFWGITPRSSAIQMEGRFKEIEYLINLVKRHLGNNESYFSHGGSTFGKTDLQILTDVHNVMKINFREELKIIGKRIHERA